MKKGITPVIALVMLMLITVGMVGIAYSWFSGLLSTQTEKGVSVPPGGAYCSAGLISVLIQNNGASSSIIGTDLIVAQVDGTDVNAIIDSAPDGGAMGRDGRLPLGVGAQYPAIASGSGGIFIKDYDCSGATTGDPSVPLAISQCLSGSHNIRVGTRTGIVETTAYCK